MAEALYRKYRPQIFEDVVGQEHIERTLKNAIDQDKVSHAYLFCGPRGTGKTTTARLLAKALLCKGGPTSEPDGSCDNCKAIADNLHPDVYELDAASRTGVENVREEIIGRVQFAPTQGRYKVYIIDEVHMLSTAAFNALLKTLEEPPLHVVFVLCTTDPQKVPETIHSRCQRFDFHRISSEAIVSRLGAICVAEDVEFEGDALDLIAYRAEGGMRNALTSLEQLITFGEGKVTLADAERLLGSLDTSDMAEIVSAIGKRDTAACFTWTANFVETGADLAQFVRSLTEHARNMYILSLSGTDTVLEVSEAMRRELAQELEWFGPDRIARMMGVLGDLSAELRTATNPRMSFEIALTRLTRPESDLTLESLAERIEALEAGRATAPIIPVQVIQHNEPQEVQNKIPDKKPSSEPLPSESQGAAEVEEEPFSSAKPTDAPCPTTSQGLTNPAALQRVWQATLQTIKKEKAAYGVLFMNTKIHYREESDSVTIEFPAENTFAFSAVQKPEVMTLLSTALEKAAGKSIPFNIVQAAAGSGAGTTQQVQAFSSDSFDVADQDAALLQKTPTPPQEALSPTQQEPSTESAQKAEPIKTPEPIDLDMPPLDVYETYAPFEDVLPEKEAVEIEDKKVSLAEKATEKSEALTQEGEEDVLALLAETYGDGVIVEEVSDEQDGL